MNRTLNENENGKCSLLLSVAHFGFWGVFPFAVGCFLLSSLLVLVFEIESKTKIKISKTKTGNCLLGCSFWHFKIALLVLVFCWYEKPKQSTKQRRI